LAAALRENCKFFGGGNPPPQKKKMRGTNTAFAVQVICSEMGDKAAPSQSTNDIAPHGNKCATTRKQTNNNNNVTTVDS